MNKTASTPLTDFYFNGKTILSKHISSFINCLKQSKSTIDTDLGYFLAEWFNDLAYIQVKTSGSTGKPKNIQLSKKSMIASAKNTLAYFNLSPGDTICLTLPCTYIAGKMMIIRALIGKLNLLTTPISSNPFTNHTKPFSFVALVPNQIESFFTYEHLKKCTSKVLVGGGIISDMLLKKIQNSPSLFYQSYAMTETASHVAIRAINNNNLTQIAYKALAGISFTTDHRNCLVIHSNYLDHHHYVTNDIVELLSPTSFLWKGRFDNIINSAGIKLSPELIETKLEPLIKQRFYIGKMDDDILGHKIVLVIEGNKKLFDTNKLNVRMEQVLHKHEIPKHLIIREKFEETPTGKILREY